MRKEPLESLCDIKIGRTPPRKDEKYWGKGYKWVSISDMKEKVINSTKEEITETAIKSINCRKIPKGTLLLSFKLSIGKRAFAGEDLFTNEAIAALIIKNTSILDNLYLYFALGAIELIGGNNAAMGTTLNSKSLAALQIPLPPLEDQKRIASILSRVEKLIAQRKESIQLLDELLKSTFLEMFGDPVRNEKGWSFLPLIKFGAISTGNTPPRNKPENYSDGIIEWIKTDNILSDSAIISKATEMLSEIGLKKGRIVKKNALLVACIAGSIESIGRAALTDRLVAFNQQINAIQPNEDVNPFFLYFLFIISRKYIQSHATKGMKKILTKGDFIKIKMIKPPIDLQNQFAIIVEKIESIKSHYQKSQTELENLYGSLGQKAFKGELNLSKIPVPKDDEPGDKGKKTIQIQAFQGKDEPEEKTENKTLKTFAAVALTAGGVYLAKKLFESITREDERIEDFILTESYLNEIIPKTVLLKMFDDVEGKFSFIDLWEKTREAIISEMPDNVSMSSGWEDDLYQHIKSELFNLLEEKKLSQIFDEEKKEMLLSVNR